MVRSLSPAEVPAAYSDPYAAAGSSRATFAGMLACADEGLANVTASDTCWFFCTPALWM